MISDGSISKRFFSFQKKTISSKNSLWLTEADTEFMEKLWGTSQKQNEVKEQGLEKDEN